MSKQAAKRSAKALRLRFGNSAESREAAESETTMSEAKTIRTEAEAREAIESGARVALPIPRDVLAELGAPDLRKLASRAGIGVMFSMSGTASVLVSVLSGESAPSEWAQTSDGWRRFKREAPEAEAPEAPEPEPEAEAPKPEPEREEKPSPEETSALDQALGTVFGSIAKREVGREVARLLEEADIARPIVIRAASRDIKIKPGAHKSAGLIARMFALGFRNFSMVGPMGSGKTTLAKSVAESLGASFDLIGLSEGVSESAVFGRVAPLAEDPKTGYSESAFVREYRTGGVFLLDEADSADPNMLVSINAALANDRLSIPLAGLSFDRHPDALVFFAMNTFGTGADRMYVGRNALDAATLDRFNCAVIEVDYDRALERRIAEAYLSDDSIKRAWLLAFTEAARSAINEKAMRRACSTRFVKAGAMLLAGGFTREQVRERFLIGWGADERAKLRDTCGVDVWGAEEAEPLPV